MYRKWLGWKKVAVCLVGVCNDHAGRKHCHGF